MRPCGGDAGGHTGSAPTHSHDIFPHKQNNHLHTIHPNATNRPCAICPNETVGAVPVCPPERPRSGVSIPKIHALCTGNERWIRPCGATRAGTQAPPLPISTKPRGVAIPHRGYTFDSAGLASAASLPWVTMQARRLPPWGLYFFSSHIITTCGE